MSGASDRRSHVRRGRPHRKCPRAVASADRACTRNARLVYTWGIEVVAYPRRTRCFNCGASPQDVTVSHMEELARVALAVVVVACSSESGPTCLGRSARAVESAGRNELVSNPGSAIRTTLEGKQLINYLVTVHEMLRDDSSICWIALPVKRPHSGKPFRMLEERRNDFG